jgi:hypothetical protein
MTKEEGTSFLKKRAKNLLIMGARRSQHRGSHFQEFFASFFQKRSSFFLVMGL